MKNIINYIFEHFENSKFSIIEKLKINSNTGNFDYSDKELMDDYNTVAMTYTKSEKQEIASKYGVAVIKIRDIQLAILRENRKNKKEFTKDDVINFLRYDIPDTYNKFEKYLDQEPIEFVEYLLQYYEDKINKDPRIKKYRYYPQALSYADRHLLKVYDNLKKFIG